MGDDDQDGDGPVYKTKLVQFLGRSVPIILQSDNGPCPLLSICNVLLLRNNVSINTEMNEISTRDLLSLVAERLLDANYNLEGKDEEYVRNQQQNIADSINLLPRLATGIDVNVRFRTTQDFEFTPECAIFDLLDIGLYHGWICEDDNTKGVIGADSYNTLADRLAALQASRPETRTLERESSVDFNAAITATFTVPSPSLSSVIRSLSGSPNENLLEEVSDSGSSAGKRRKGDELEAAQLLEALELSKSGVGALSTAILNTGGSGDYSAEEFLSEGSPQREETVPSAEVSEGSPLHQVEEGQSDVMSLNSGSDEHAGPVELSHQSLTPSDVRQTMVDVEAFVGGALEVRTVGTNISHDGDGRATVRAQSGAGLVHEDFKLLSVEDRRKDIVDMKDWIVLPKAFGDSNAAVHPSGVDGGAVTGVDGGAVTGVDGGAVTGVDGLHCLASDAPGERVGDATALDEAPGSEHEEATVGGEADSTKTLDQDTKPGPEGVAIALSQLKDSERLVSQGGCEPNVPSTYIAQFNEQEALYEGEVVQGGIGCSQDDIGCPQDDTKEPLYEGEAALAEQASLSSVQESRPACSEAIVNSEDADSTAARTEEQLIADFLIKSNQLTWTGLFNLQEEVKDRELCVFFRNNHFSTMFKYNKDLYLLATDQGYLNQTDLVWEKLDRVDGNHSFFTGNFTPFQAESNVGTWNEQDALTRTENFISTQREAVASGADYNTDLQLALALQQQEFDEQQTQEEHPAAQEAAQQQLRQRIAEPLPAPQPTRSTALSAVNRLITGPRTSTASSKPDAKKEKCVIM